MHWDLPGFPTVSGTHLDRPSRNASMTVSRSSRHFRKPRRWLWNLDIFQNIKGKVMKTPRMTFTCWNMLELMNQNHYAVNIRKPLSEVSFGSTLWIYLLIEGSLEAKLPTIWTDEKQSREEAERRERLEERRSEKRKNQKKEDADARKGRNVVKHWKSRFPVFFQWFVAPEGGKVGSLKRRVRRQLARWEMRKCTPLWHEAHFQVKMYKTHQVRTTFGSCDVEKVHAVVARSTCPSQNAQNTPMSDHFWKLRCRKSARRCGAKHMSKSKCTKHHMVGPLLEVAMSKKCTPLWREAHFQVKMYKAPRVRTTFGGSDVDFRKSARRCGAKHISKSKCTKHTMFGPLLEAQMSTFEKVHAVVARSTFPSQNVKNWGFWAFFDVKMSKK